jgi:hypothetical protein
MKWWQIRKRDADFERELQSDLEQEEEEQPEKGLSAKKHVTRPGAPLETQRVSGNKPMRRGAGPLSNAFHRMFVMHCDNCGDLRDSVSLR